MPTVKKILFWLAITILATFTGCRDTEPVKVPSVPEIKLDGNLQSLDLQIISGDQERLLLGRDGLELTLCSGSAGVLFSNIPVIMTMPASCQDNLWQLDKAMADNFLRPLIMPEKCRYRVILIDPGHGGRDSGAVSASGIKEKDLNLQLSLFLAEALRARGYTVHLTRSDDRYLSLDERPGMIARYKADLFISVHHNSAANTAASGHEVYFLRSENDAETALAISSIQRAFQIEKSLSIHLPQTAVRGVKCARFKVLRLSTVPSILIEAGFVSNPEEVQILSSITYQQLFAEAVASSF